MVETSCGAALIPCVMTDESDRPASENFDYETGVIVVEPLQVVTCIRTQLTASALIDAFAEQGYHALMTAKRWTASHDPHPDRQTADNTEPATAASPLAPVERSSVQALGFLDGDGI
ncbi:hypothetical protein A5658_12865 [Mycobacterium sp. 1245111.1]|nr:hypothetical protein A5658_12865 [Mycobacterium sp. 1245111.1]